VTPAVRLPSLLHPKRSLSVFSCPHCGKPIEVTPQAKVPWWRYDPGGTPVSLGCGTLILIAIIVAMFSGNAGSGVQQLRNDIQALERKIGDLQLKLRNDQRVAQ
jgi:hypothetical protein